MNPLGIARDFIPDLWVMISPQGEGKPFPILENKLRAGFTDALAAILPLPAGEGRSEGERGVRKGYCSKTEMLPPKWQIGFKNSHHGTNRCCDASHSRQAKHGERNEGILVGFRLSGLPK